MQEELIYGYDPLCGWCFAFRPTLNAIVTANPDLPVRLLYGGLVVGERVQPIAAARDYLVRGLAQVRQRAGVVAGEAFYNGLLAEGTHVSNSEPPCRALLAVQQLAPERAYPFADSLPEAYYGHGRPLDDEAVLGDLATAQGIDRDAFLRLWRSDEAKRATQAAFANARAQGISTYPTLFYRRGDDIALVAQGFLEPDAGVKRIEMLRHTSDAAAA